MSSCFSYTPPKHNYAREWSSDAEHHWHACTDESCDSTFSYASHSFDSGTADIAAGKRIFTCIFCDYQKSEDYTARTEVTASEWNEALAVEKFNNLFLETVTKSDLHESRMEIKYTKDMMLIVSSETGKVNERYTANSEDNEFGSAALIGFLRDILHGEFNMFRYDAEEKCYSGLIKNSDDRVIDVSCQFADGSLLAVSITTVDDYDEIVYEYKFSRYGEVAIEIPVDFVKSQLDAAVSAENLSNVSIYGSFKGESIRLLVEGAHSSDYPKMQEVVNEILAFEFSGISELIIIDGAVDVALDGTGDAATRIDFKNGKLIAFGGAETDLEFYDYGTTDDGEIYEGSGGENETPIRPV